MRCRCKHWAWCCPQHISIPTCVRVFGGGCVNNILSATRSQLQVAQGPFFQFHMDISVSLSTLWMRLLTCNTLNISLTAKVVIFLLLLLILSNQGHDKYPEACSCCSKMPATRTHRCKMSYTSRLSPSLSDNGLRWYWWYSLCLAHSKSTSMKSCSA